MKDFSSDLQVKLYRLDALKLLKFACLVSLGEQMASFTLNNHTSIDFTKVNDVDMPLPSNFSTIAKDNCIQWDINNYCHTKDSMAFIMDIAIKVSLILKTSILDINYNTTITRQQSHELQDFQHIQDLRPTKRKNTGLNMESTDTVFIAMRLAAIELKRSGVSDFEELIYTTGLSMNATANACKSKARSVQRYFDNNPHAHLGRSKKTDMNRSQNAIFQSQTISIKKWESFKSFIEPLEAFGIVENISTIAKALDIERITVRKYIKKLQILRETTKTFLNFLSGQSIALRGIEHTGNSIEPQRYIMPLVIFLNRALTINTNEYRLFSKIKYLKL